MGSSRRVRVLITSTPGMGHLQSVMPLARALTQAGHEVLCATASQSCDLLSERGFTVTPAGLNVADRRAAFAPRMPEVMALAPRDRRGLFFTGFFADAAAPAMYHDLGPVFDAFRPELVVHEFGELAAAPMAIARGLPHITVAFSGTLPRPAIPMLIDSLADLWSTARAGTPTWERIIGDLYLHPFPPALASAPDVDVDVVRPCRPTSVEPDIDELPDWLTAFGRDRPGVYLTSGTEAASMQAPWNEALSAVGSLDVDAVVTTGPFVDPAAFTAIPPNVHVERFFPHASVLRRASLVSSHAGAGTMLASASLGLPQLLCPLAADQWENADALVGSGAGLICEMDGRSATDLAETIVRLLDEPAFRDAGARLAAEMRLMPTAADHVPEIIRLADR